jgi:biopolymer transport protein TolR
MAIGIGNKAEINVTPLIDVLLVLLIIFMVIQPQLSTGHDTKIPQPSTGPADASRRDIVVSVAEDHGLQINTQPVAWEVLEARLRAVFAVRPNGVLFVAAASSIEFKEVAAVIDTARGVGVGRIALMPR